MDSRYVQETIDAILDLLEKYGVLNSTVISNIKSDKAYIDLTVQAKT